MRRLLIALSALLILGVIVPAAAAAQEATPGPGLARTDIRYISPYTPDGLNPALTVVTTGEGVCAHESIDVLGRPDAWDCISESDVVYDPCFENPFVDPDAMGEVACFDTPFSTDVTVLTLTRPLAREQEEPEQPDRGLAPDAGGDLEPWDLPWAMELANGEQCTLLGGTLTVVAGQVVHYGCTGGGSILGETDRSQPVWVVSYIAEDAYETSLVEVVTAWS